MRRYVTFLVSDECEGRGVETKGIDKAAAYIAAARTLRITINPILFEERHSQSPAELPDPARSILDPPKHISAPLDGCWCSVARLIIGSLAWSLQFPARATESRQPGTRTESVAPSYQHRRRRPR